MRVSIVETGEDSLLTWMDLSCLFSYAIKQVLWKHQQISQQGDGNKSSEKKKREKKKINLLLQWLLLGRAQML